MKKVYMLLSALMLGAGGVTTAQAQAVQIDGVSYVKTAKVPSGTEAHPNVTSKVNALTDLTDGGTYLLLNTGHQRFFYENPDNNELWLDQISGLGNSSTPEDITNALAGKKYVVTFEKVADKENTFKIKCNSGKYVGTLKVTRADTPAMTSEDHAEEFEIAPVEGQEGKFTLKGLNSKDADGKQLWFNGNPGKFGAWTDNTGDNGFYMFFKVDGEKDVTVYTYNPTLEPGKYYNILASRGDEAVGAYSDAQKRWVSSESIVADAQGTVQADPSRVIRRTGRTGNPASMLWSFEQNEDGIYKIRNANTGLLFGEWVANGAGIEMPISKDNGGNYELTPVTESETNDQFFLKQNGHLINAFMGLENNDILADYKGNSTTDAGNFWSFVEVTKIPLKIYHDTEWASVKYPFAVTLPEGLKAYTVSSVADGKAELAELGTEVPANTAALIADERQGGEETGDYDTFDLTINYGATTAAAEGNLLEGTTVSRQGFAENAGYVLAAGPSLKLTGTVTTIPANKAYLPATAAGTTAQALALHFGEATGIDHATVETEANQQWYDLQGRRVLYPAKGIFVGQNGKKVLFK